VTIRWPDLLHNGYKNVAEMLHDLHHNKNMTQDMMAEHLGVSRKAMVVEARRLGIIFKKRYGAKYSRNPYLRP
jgi:predicted transcriptional regulator